MTVPPTVGLCVTCRWMRAVTTRKGSTFIRCGRADTDPRFPRYPALPVRQCDGFEDRSATPPEVGEAPAE